MASSLADLVGAGYGQAQRKGLLGLGIGFGSKSPLQSDPPSRAFCPQLAEIVPGPPGCDPGLDGHWSLAFSPQIPPAKDLLAYL